MKCDAILIYKFASAGKRIQYGEDPVGLRVSPSHARRQVCCLAAFSKFEVGDSNLGSTKRKAKKNP